MKRLKACTQHLLERLRSESGQSLPLLVLMLAVIIGAGALAIDLAGDYQARHKAQVAADAAALAAANCLADSKCTSTSANGDAYNVASNYVSQNGASLGSISIGGGYVTVTTATQAPSVFGSYFGLNRNASARAVATYHQGTTAPASVYGADCSNPTIPPATNSANCTVNCSTPGVTVQTDGGTNISGGIATNGSVDIKMSGNSSIGPVEYGDAGDASAPGTSCAPQNSVTTSGGATLNGSSSGQPVEEKSWLGFPLTYNDVWTNSTSNMCSSSLQGSDYGLGSNVVASSANSKYPSTVTISGNNSSSGSNSTPVIICANTINLAGNSMVLTNMTLVANTFTFSGNGFTISPASTAISDSGQTPNVAIYSTSTSGLNFGGNNISVNSGTVYAPEGNISIAANNGIGGLIEGNTVSITGNNTADGPVLIFPSSTGGDSLYQ